MENKTEALIKQKPEAAFVEYIPLGASDKIKMTVAIVQKYIAVPTKTGKTCSERDAVRFLGMCSAKRINPMEGDCYLIGYDSKDGPTFSLVTAHQTYLKRAELHPEFDGMDSGVIVLCEDGALKDLAGDFYEEGQKVVGGWATVHFKSRKHPMVKRLRMSTFNKGYGQWGDNANGMIVKCFDEETEVLTTRGFERFAVAEGNILQVTQCGLEPTEAVPFSQDYSGQMIEYDCRNGNFCVTPNHDMPLAINGDPTAKIEARHLLDIHQRDEVAMPLCAFFDRPDYPIEDKWLVLAAAYLADGSDNSASSGFSIAVSRSYKVDLLRSLGLHRSESTKNDGGTAAVCSSGRVIVTRSDKQVFYYSRSPELDWLVGRKKSVQVGSLLALSTRQARVFLCAWLECDGQELPKMRLGRIYTSRPDHCAAIELAANVAGLSVSQRKARQSDIGGTNYSLTITNRAISNLTRPKIVERPNTGKSVWCVKVPSGKIIVRRHGFSAVCFQCAEADALRSSFPTMLGGLYMREEVDMVAQFAKPDFNAPSKPLFGSTVEIPAGEAEAPNEFHPEQVGGVRIETPGAEDAPVGTAKSPPAEPEPAGGFNPIKSLRGLLSMAKIKEGEYMDWLAATGATDGSYGSLEDLLLSKGSAWMKTITEDWPQISAAMLAAKKKGKA
jgi:RecT family